MSERVVLDTNVLVAAFKSEDGASRAILRLCLVRRCEPLLGLKLFTEYEDVLGRSDLFLDSPLTPRERAELFDAFLSVCERVSVFYLWRPNLTDQSDNHLIELAVAGTAATLVTLNVRHFRGGELRFPQLAIETPAPFMRRWRENYGNDDNSHS
jgi:uncharacterized protein